jgi:hypothetical protein
MPAIHLPRLEKQVEALAKNYADAEKFSRQLKVLFTYYGDRTRRPSQKTRKASRLPAEHVPAPVLRQIVTQLTPYAEHTPHAILNLCRGLWPHQVLEFRLLAAQLLGKVAASHAEETLDLVQAWNLGNKEGKLLETLASTSLNTIRHAQPDLLLARIEDWLAPDEENLKKAQAASMQKLGIGALVPYVEDPAFENLPHIYRLVKPMLRSISRALRPFLVDLLVPLAERAPQEVAFILRTELELEPSKDLKWLGRRVLPHLGEESQSRLRPLVTRQPEE